MKNKILLLFVLLIPSLCFGESTRISYNNISKTTLTITFFDQYTNGLVKQGKGQLNEFYLKKENGKFSYSENMKELYRMLARLGLIFTNDKQTNVDSAFDNRWIDSFKEKGEISYTEIYTTIESLFIYRGFTVNFIDRIGGSPNLMNYYLSRPK